MVKNPSSYQSRFFEMVRTRVPDNEMLVDILAELIDCSRDSAYRRIRGTTELSVNDMVKIAKHFNISLNEWVGQSDSSVIFQSNSFIESLEGFRNHLLKSYGELERIAQFPKHQLIMQAKDVPYYYQFRSKKLAAFKVFVWLKSMYQLDQLEGLDFNVNSIPDDIIDLCLKIGEAYTKVNSIEIWNDDTMLSMVKELEYYYEAGLLNSKEEALELCQEMYAISKVLYRQALKGQKAHYSKSEEYGQGDYQMYFHEILVMDNHILAQLDENRKAYFIPFAGLNYLQSQDAGLSQKMENFLNDQIKKSSLISNMSEKERNKFFIRIKNRIDQLKNKIEITNPFM